MKKLIAASLWLTFLIATTAIAQAAGPCEAPCLERSLADVVERAEALEPLETLIIAQNGEILVDEGFRGHSTGEPTNIKSASKAIISALVGIAIDKELLEGPDQKIAPLLRDKLPEDADPLIHDITIGNLLSMQAGLARTSGVNYGRWVSSKDWVRAALAQPFAGEPGGGMLYSTGKYTSHLGILTRQSGSSTLELARAWLEALEDFAIADWIRDPQGIYLGGNQMAMSAKSMLSFGELYRNGGKVGDRQVISQDWIETSWQPRTRSVFHDDQYGYGWFITDMADHRVNYAWGHGGQMIYVVPSLGLTDIMTSAEDQPSARNGHRDNLHGLPDEGYCHTGECRKSGGTVNTRIRNRVPSSARTFFSGRKAGPADKGAAVRRMPIKWRKWHEQYQTRPLSKACMQGSRSYRVLGPGPGFSNSATSTQATTEKGDPSAQPDGGRACLLRALHACPAGVGGGGAGAGNRPRGAAFDPTVAQGFPRA